MAKFCRQCGNQLADEARFCNNCGASTGENTFNNNSNYQQGRRSRMAAGLLAIFLGGLGIHHYYLGNSKKGTTYLLVSLLTCGFGATVIEIFSIIDAVKIFTDREYLDADGNTLND